MYIPYTNIGSAIKVSDAVKEVILSQPTFVIGHSLNVSQV